MAKLSPEKYRDILTGLHLIEIRLVDVSASLNEALLDQSMSVKIRDRARFEVDAEGLARVYIKYTITVQADGKEKAAVRIDLKYAISFHSEYEFSADFFDVYKKVSLPVKIWPFVREFVHSLTSRMNIAPLTLPLMKRN